MELRYCEECGDLIRDESSAPTHIEDKFVCDRCSKKGGPPSKAERKAASERADKAGIAEAENLNLFSTRTIAIRKQKSKAPTPAPAPAPEPSGEVQKSGRLRLVKAGEEPAPAPQPALAEGANTSSRNATKLAFKCIHCKCTLAIRPVAQTSKLICPECGRAIYVTTSGRLLKSSPSTAIRKEEDSARIPGGSASMRSDASSRGKSPGGSVRQASVRQANLRQGSVFARVGGGSARAQSSTAVAEAPPALLGAPRDPVERQRSSRNAVAPKAPSVRLSSSNPRDAELHPKPSSAFEEHMTNEDPEKTIFITEEPETSLKDVRIPEAIRSPAPAAKDQRRPKSIRVVPAAKAAPLLTDESDLLDEETDVVTVPAGGFDADAERKPLPLRKDVQRAPVAPVKTHTTKRPGIAKRAFKALFSP